MARSLRFWLFCDVIDNFGDVGVTLRLARRLGSMGHRAVVWHNGPAAFGALEPQVAPNRFWTPIRHAEAVRWRGPDPDGDPASAPLLAFDRDAPAFPKPLDARESGLREASRVLFEPAPGAGSRADGAERAFSRPAWDWESRLDALAHDPERPDAAIEMFGCDLGRRAEEFFGKAGVLWLNWEYLRFDEAALNHMAASLRPTAKKYFFCMGLGDKTGGLLLGDVDRALARRQSETAWRPRPARAGSRARTRMLVFGYFNADLPIQAAKFASACIQSLSRESSKAPSCLKPPTLGFASAQMWRLRAWMESARPDSECLGGPAQGRGAARLVDLEMVPQDSFDGLLQSADAALARGEDSLVRALASGKPFWWQAYPQTQGASRGQSAALWAQIYPSWPSDLAFAHALCQCWLNAETEMFVASSHPSSLDAQCAPGDAPESRGRNAGKELAGRNEPKDPMDSKEPNEFNEPGAPNEHEELFGRDGREESGERGGAPEKAGKETNKNGKDDAWIPNPSVLAWGLRLGGVELDLLGPLAADWLNESGSGEEPRPPAGEDAAAAAGPDRGADADAERLGAAAEVVLGRIAPAQAGGSGPGDLVLPAASLEAACSFLLRRLARWEKAQCAFSDRLLAAQKGRDAADRLVEIVRRSAPAQSAGSLRP